MATRKETVGGDPDASFRHLLRAAITTKDPGTFIGFYRKYAGCMILADDLPNRGDISVVPAENVCLLLGSSAVEVGLRISDAIDDPLILTPDRVGQLALDNFAELVPDNVQ